MDFNDLKNELNNPKVSLDNGKLAMEYISNNLYSMYHLRIILRTQIEILEHLKGKTGNELIEAVEEKQTYWNNEFDEWHKVDFPSTIQDCVSE